MSLSVHPVVHALHHHRAEASPYALAAAAALAQLPQHGHVMPVKLGKVGKVLALEAAARRVRHRHPLLVEAMLQRVALHHGPGRLAVSQMMRHVAAGMEGNGLHRPGSLLQTSA
ncbi:hypothetical protein [Paludibacterium sp. B53371]|uniref:hypothetical protein n=1 Tax=Paludibacterium sp. B53371 TaxID=2806263 RepID=UPI001C0444BA|nr:hypothetical protein [Paludibacterium sp. B53371]